MIMCVYILDMRVFAHQFVSSTIFNQADCHVFTFFCSWNVSKNGKGLNRDG